MKQIMMGLLLTPFTIGFLVFAKPPADHTWKIGTVQEQEHHKTPGDGFLVMPMPWERLRIVGDGYAYDVARETPWRKPNVTINGPIKYAIEPGGKFYITDDDQRVFEMKLQRKTLLPAAPEAGGH